MVPCPSPTRPHPHDPYRGRGFVESASPTTALNSGVVDSEGSVADADPAHGRAPRLNDHDERGSTNLRSPAPTAARRRRRRQRGTPARREYTRAAAPARTPPPRPSRHRPRVPADEPRTSARCPGSSSMTSRTSDPGSHRDRAASLARTTRSTSDSTPRHQREVPGVIDHRAPSRITVQRIGIRARSPDSSELGHHFIAGHRPRPEPRIQAQRRIVPSTTCHTTDDHTTTALNATSSWRGRAGGPRR